jgi:hypothetical protein
MGFFGTDRLSLIPALSFLAGQGGRGFLKPFKDLWFIKDRELQI